MKQKFNDKSQKNKKRTRFPLFILLPVSCTIGGLIGSQIFKNDNTDCINEIFRTTITMSPELSEPISPFERSLLENIFGEEIDTSRLQKNYYNVPTSCAYASVSTFTPNHIDFYRLTPVSQDLEYQAYNAPTRERGTFVHEATHVWQFQKHPITWVTYFFKDKNYEYDVSYENARFNQYGLEQQASIIADYAQQFLNPQTYDRKNPIIDENGQHHYISVHRDKNSESLRNVVESRFPRARELRQHIERHGYSPWDESRPLKRYTHFGRETY